jgi:hypothetical protein
MILMPHVHSNISITAKLGVINCQFYRFLRLCSQKDFFLSDGQSYCPPQEYPVKRGLEGCSLNENSFLEIQHLEHSKWFCVSDELLGSHLVNVFHCCPFLCV